MAHELRLRHLGAGAQRARSRAVDLLRLSRRHQAAERRGDVGRPAVDVLGHLLRARPARRHADRAAGAGDHRRPGDQVADRALPARARVQPAVLRRPGVGHRGAGRHGRGRPHAGDQVARSACCTRSTISGRRPSPTSPCSGRRACPTASSASPIKTSIDTSAIQYESRRPDAAEVGRRLRHRLLRVGDAGRQADAVLRRAREPAQDPALCAERRPRRDERRPGRAEARADHRRRARLRRGHGRGSIR